jgi:hypothetical protein
MSEETALVPIEERQVDFYGDEIITALAEVKGEEQVLVPLRPICEYLGLNWSAQSRRLKRDMVLSEVQLVAVMATSQGKVGMICLPLEYLNGWLFGIDASRVKVELQDKVIRYQRDCYKVLSRHFQGEAALYPTGPAPSAGLLQIREMGLAIVKMAEEQIVLERNVNRAHSRLDQAALVVGDIQRRLGVVEKKLSPPAFITEDQAVEISQRVKALSEFLTGKDKAKNHYQGIFGELYRRFGVSSYKSIPLSRYEDVLKFLEEWRQSASSATGGTNNKKEDPPGQGSMFGDDNPPDTI